MNNKVAMCQDNRYSLMKVETCEKFPMYYLGVNANSI